MYVEFKFPRTRDHTTGQIESWTSSLQEKEFRLFLLILGTLSYVPFSIYPLLAKLIRISRRQHLPGSSSSSSTVRAIELENRDHSIRSQDQDRKFVKRDVFFYLQGSNHPRQWSRARIHPGLNINCNSMPSSRIPVNEAGISTIPSLFPSQAFEEKMRL